MRTSLRIAGLGLTVLLVGWFGSGSLRADPRRKAIQELAETLAKSGRPAGRNVPALTRQIETLAARHGDEALVALSKVGPKTFGLVEAAGPEAAQAIKVLARHGEAGATRVLTRPAALSAYRRFGDRAADVLVKHPGVAEGLIQRGGSAGVEALATITPRNGRRLAMVLEGELAKTGQHPELLAVVARYGDRAAEFVWQNKGALAVSAVLVAFLADPAPFLAGTRDLSVAATLGVAQPLAREAARSVDWNRIALVGLAGGGVLLAGGWMWWRTRKGEGGVR